MQQDHSLYIPLGVKPETEWFPGFGGRQLSQAAIGSLFALITAILFWFCGSSVPVVMVTFLIGISASVMMITKDRHNVSVLDQIIWMTRFAKSQKYYPYRCLNQWETNPNGKWS